MSLPSLGAWIEDCLIPQRLATYHCRSLRWERGLKIKLVICLFYILKSLPSLGAWIEDLKVSKVGLLLATSLPSLGAWIEESATTSVV